MRRKTQNLSVKKVLAEFRKAENSTAHRKGTFKIDVPFEDALKAIAKAKPEPKAWNRKTLATVTPNPKT